MLKRIIISGAGGQGIILLGKLIARTALGKVKHITFFPAYGAEVRGGASYCEVIISSTEISSPCAEQADIIILMNQNGASDFIRRLARGGMVLINSSLCKVTSPPGITTIRIPASKLAEQTGSLRSANLIMLGALQQHNPLFNNADFDNAITEAFAGTKPELLDINLKAFYTGLHYPDPVADELAPKCAGQR